MIASFFGIVLLRLSLKNIDVLAKLLNKVLLQLTKLKQFQVRAIKIQEVMRVPRAATRRPESTAQAAGLTLNFQLNRGGGCPIVLSSGEYIISVVEKGSVSAMAAQLE